jgi:hypothetical protein
MRDAGPATTIAGVLARASARRARENGRPKEVIMPTRRIAATVCALCLAAPTAAAAQPYESARPGHARSAIAGNTENDRHLSAPAPAANASTDGWRIAAIAEATLLAICTAGTAVVLARRRRDSQLGA